MDGIENEYMGMIAGSVGQNGKNNVRDVKVVQRLLNKHSLPPLRSLAIDGIAGQQTIDAIEHFQSVVVKMRTPDGRVDPGGKTFRFLNRSSAHSNTKQESPKTSKPRRGRASWGKFVSNKVKTIPLTEKIINYIFPHFKDTSNTVISGYLSEADLYWKVNWHWELLLSMVEHSLTLPMDEKHRKNLQSILTALLSVKPNPSSGYLRKNTIGIPIDKSTSKEFDKRYKVLKQSKLNFKNIVIAASLQKKQKKRLKDFQLSYQPVAHPGWGNHKTGYALDISGNNSQIKAICKSLGATMTFDEKNHVHVEFKGGIPKK